MPDLADLYPPAPAHVPPDLTKPTPGYRARVLVVLVSLFLFVALYVGLVVGSAYLCYHSFATLGSDPQPRDYRAYRPKSERNDGWWVFVGIASGLLCLFLVKGFFKRRKPEETLRVEVTEQEQPLLFGFIRQLCRDTRAPFPHRVFLVPDVNAAVFYHESFLSLFLPTPKNLLIGLGLVNRLTLSEFKAVLAHEFGHFSQSSMKLGTYVYTSNRIIGEIVYGRDWLDDTVNMLCRTDVRIAVFAWGFKGVLWGLRKGLQGVFKVINFANSALSRQMEFNADLVAVRVTGSDALVNGLARLDLAGESLNLAWRDLVTAADRKLYTRDLFYHQDRAAEHIKAQQKDPKLGEPPALPADTKEAVQVFAAEDTSVPKMWATHPSNHDREANAKRLYLRSPLDERSPWLLFQGAEAVRERMTRAVYKSALQLEDVKAEAPEAVQAFIDDEHAETTYHPRYCGFYDNRYLTPGDLDELMTASTADLAEPQRLSEAHRELYGEAMAARMALHQSRHKEFGLLSSLANGAVELRGKDFQFRQARYRPADAKRLLGEVQKELDDDFKWMEQQDRRAFLVHLAMARHLGDDDWRELEARYRFHQALQEIHHTLNAHSRHVQATLEPMAGQREVSQEQFHGALAVLRQAHAALKGRLEAAASLKLPALTNVTAGEPLAPYLLAKPLLPGLDGPQKSLDGGWIGQLMQQMGEVIDKAGRFHFKSLGKLLALQEDIVRRWAERPAV